jgi:hypothetical protein
MITSVPEIASANLRLMPSQAIRRQELTRKMPNANPGPIWIGRLPPLDAPGDYVATSSRTPQPHLNLISP